MATAGDMCAVVAVIILGFLCSQGLSTATVKSEELQYCSFFNNRAPRAQPGLKNCTWFKDNSCCMQQEIAATFGRVKPLKGASLACQKYVNYLMCYICAPNQNIFYRQERLTVCESFCDALYDSCNSAILKGSVIRNLYSSGEEFCQSRRFQVAKTGCFTFDVALDTSSSGQVKANSAFVIALLCLCVYTLCPFGSGESVKLAVNVVGRRHRKARPKSGGGLTGSSRSSAHTTTRPTSCSRSNMGSSSLQEAGNGASTSNPHTMTSDTCSEDESAPTQETLLGAAAVKFPPPPCRPPPPPATPTPAQPPVVANNTTADGKECSSSHNMLYRRPGKLSLWIDSALAICFVLLLLHFPKGATALSEHDIERWADLLSAKLTGIAKKGLRYEEIQHLYDRAQYATEYVNGTAKVLEVREKLGTYFVSKKRRALELADWVRQVHDEWWDQTKQVRGQAGAWGHRWRREAQPEDIRYDHWERPDYRSRGTERGTAKDKDTTSRDDPRQWTWTPEERDLTDPGMAGVNLQGELPEIDDLDSGWHSTRGHHAGSRPLHQSGTGGPVKDMTGKVNTESDLRYEEAPSGWEYEQDGSSRPRRSKVLLPNHGVDPVVNDREVPLPPYVHANDLGIDVYKDADIPKRLPKNLFKYDRDFRRNIMPEHSTVKIPDDVPRDNQDVYDTISWTARMDEMFRENRHKDSTLRRRGQYAPRWQYFGSASGVHRVFPGHEWPANFIGFHEDYDPRTRPWYVSATSGPKNLVLVLDSSASMSEDGSIGRMKSVASNILSTLTKKDSVNIVVSRSEYWSRKGVYYPHKAEVISCHETSLMPASTSNLKELLTAVQDLQPYGGSYHIEAFQKAFHLLKNASHDDCQSFIIFVTDGQSRDLDHRCSPGYYKYDGENRKHYHPGERCVYDFDEVTHIVSLLQYQLHKRAHLFTFLTSDKGHNRVLPGQLACDNQGAMAKVTSDTNTFHQMAPYFRFLEASSGAKSAVWTAPYVDRAGLGLVVTVSVPVYSNRTRSHLGVVGIDVELQHIENIMRHELWGSTYAFVIDSEDGSAIMHPFSKPSAQLLEDPAFVPIAHLETHMGQPRDFRHVLAAMMARETGSIKVVEQAKRAISVHNSLVWRPTEYSHYFFTDIPGSDFSFAFNLAQTDETFQHARDPPVDGPASFLHEMNLYRKLQEEIPGAWEQLRPTSTNIKYPGIEVTFEHSVVKLAPRCFCNAAAYMEEHRPSFIDIHEYINTFTPTYDVHCPRGTYRTDVRPDVKLTAALEDLWKRRDPGLQRQVAWTYMGTMGGVMRIYPGVEISRDFDPTTRPWYHRSEVNRGRLVVSSAYQDSVPGMGKVVTLSRAIHKAKPLTPPDCTGSRRGYGCPCSSNHQCKSEYCYFRSCADDLIQGVVALDLDYPDFHVLVSDVLRDTDSRKYCNLRYNCGYARPCEVRCYLIDDVGSLVYDAAFVHVPDSDTERYEDQSFATREGFLFGELLRRGIFTKHTRLNFEGVCKVSKSIPQDVSAARQWMPEPSDNPDDPTKAKGPIPPFQNEYTCLQQMVYYEANKTLLRNVSHVSGSLADSPCSAGRFHFRPVEGTNLFLIILDDYRDLSSPVNFNCHITNRVLAPGAYHVQPNSCDGDHMTTPSLPLNPPRVCHKTKDVPLYCGYSTATPPPHPGGGACILIALTAVTHLLWARGPH